MDPLIPEDAELKAHVERLEQVRSSPEVLEVIPRVAAAGFGVIPLAVGPGWVEVAAAASASPRALKTLGRLLEREVRPTPVRDGLIPMFLRRLYPKEPSINFHTFSGPEFLDDPEASRLLLTEKPHEPEPAVQDCDPDRIVLLDYAYKSYMWTVEGGATLEPSFAAGALDLAFSYGEREPGAATDAPAESAPAESDAPAASARPDVVLARRRPPSAKVLILAQESYSNVGTEHSHGWRVHEIERLPFMIHPTEIQIVGVHPDGALDLLVYDDVVQVRPGETPRFEVRYHFLSMGQMIRRHLLLKVYRLQSAAREGLALSKRPLPWTPEHLRRWLGQDLELR